jgi:hypothetical protein
MSPYVVLRTSDERYEPIKRSGLGTVLCRSVQCHSDFKLRLDLDLECDNMFLEKRLGRSERSKEKRAKVRLGKGLGGRECNGRRRCCISKSVEKFRGFSGPAETYMVFCVS